MLRRGLLRSSASSVRAGITQQTTTTTTTTSSHRRLLHSATTARGAALQGLRVGAVAMRREMACPTPRASPPPRFQQRARFSSLPEHQVVGLPALSPTMQHGQIASWVKKEGDSFGPGDVLCEIETDKATMAFEAQDEGVLAKILVPAGGEEVKVGQPIMVIVEDAGQVAAFADFVVASQPAAAAPAAVAPTPAAPSSSSPPPSAPVPGPSTEHLGPYILSPAARHLLASRSLELFKDVQGTGKGGRLTKGDVIHAISNGQVMAKVKGGSSASAPPAYAPASATAAPALAPASLAAAPVHATFPEIYAAPGTFADTKNSNMRKIIARRLAESKATVPHAYETVDCEIDAVLQFRKRLQKEYEVNVSVNDVIIRSAALALRDVPEANAFWDGKKGAAVVNSKVDISVAVATPTGLITPIITGSDRRRLTEISAAMKDLAGRARQGKLKPEEFQGGSFTISNLGMFGIDEFSAVINPPQAAIMAVGRGSKRLRAPAYTPGQNAKDLKPYAATVMTATLSFDRRVLDDALAGQFLQAFKNYMARPELLLL